MASVNVTCAACKPHDPCERCRAIVRALRDAGHAVTQTSRYDALRAATVGAYGFDACVLSVAPDERAVVDAAAVLLSRSRVALVVPRGAQQTLRAPPGFAVIEALDFRHNAFPTDWISAAGLRAPEPIETQDLGELEVPADGVDLSAAQRRLRRVARNALRELGAAGFPEDARLDLLAVLEDEIAWAKTSGTCFGVVLIHVARKGDRGASPEELQETSRIVCGLRDRVRGTVRSSDVVSQSADSLMVALAEAALEETELAKGRIKKALRKAIRAADLEEASARRVSVGSAVYPSHGTTRAALLARATASASSL